MHNLHRQIVSIKFGSHLYGTSTPASDLDIKAVHVPHPDDILLQRAKHSLSTQRSKGVGERNNADDVDSESYNLQRFLSLASDGQTVALDILFAPEWSMLTPPAPEWFEIVRNRHRLITSKSAAFVGYCRQQANKYGIKGSRVAAARAALTTLNEHIEKLGTSTKLFEIASVIDALVPENEHMGIEAIRQVSGQDVLYWNVCGRKMQYTASLKNARDVMQMLVDEYGKRALQAESQNGVDWKALSHAVRVGQQAKELLATGFVTFPLANASHILDIKLGKLLYQDVSAEIETLLEEVEAAAKVSTLPATADAEWVDGFVKDVYRSEVTKISCDND